MSPVWPPICRRLNRAISPRTMRSKIAATAARAGQRQIAVTRIPRIAAAAALPPGGRPAANDKPSRRAGGNNSMNAGITARAPACAAISAGTTSAVSARLASAPTRNRIDSSQGADAECAVAAVAHDVEFLLARRAAAETIGGVGEAVFVQRARRRHASPPRLSAAAGHAGPPDAMYERVDRRRRRADDDAGEREAPRPPAPVSRAARAALRAATASRVQKRVLALQLVERGRQATGGNQSLRRASAWAA